MRILWAAMLALVAIQLPAAAQEELRAEPALGDVISHFFPGYVLLPEKSLDPAIAGRMEGAARAMGGERSPVHIQADFDGNGFADHALLIGRTSDGADADEVFVILLGHGQGRYSKAMVSFFGALSPDIYLGHLPAGTVLPSTDSDAAEPASRVLEGPAVTLNILDRASDAFYWDAADGRFRTSQAPR